MIGQLFRALLASIIVAGAAVAASYGVTHWVPEGPTRQTVERWVTAPGQAVSARLKEDPAARKKVEAGKERIEKAGLDLKKFQDSLVGSEPAKGASEAEARRLTHLYNVGAWAGVGLAVCLVLALFSGIESIGAALALGLKVTLVLVFLQGALILGGVLALSKLGG